MPDRIQIVEDEAKLARFVELELTHEGYEVDKVADGRAGEEAALSRSEEHTSELQSRE